MADSLDTPARTPASPFDVLLDFERRSLAHVAGLPEQIEAPGLWRGIGFRVGDKHLVSGIGEINEILTFPPVTHVPGSRRWLLGIANVRGNLVPIVDLKDFLSQQPSRVDERTRVLVVRQQGGGVGLVIDELLGQRSFMDEQRSPERVIDDERLARYIDHEYRLGETVWAAFNMGSLVRSPEFQQAAA